MAGVKKTSFKIIRKLKKYFVVYKQKCFKSNLKEQKLLIQIQYALIYKNIGTCNYITLEVVFLNGKQTNFLRKAADLNIENKHRGTFKIGEGTELRSV